jgi:hypothetical protein
LGAAFSLLLEELALTPALDRYAGLALKQGFSGHAIVAIVVRAIWLQPLAITGRYQWTLGV